MMLQKRPQPYCSNSEASTIVVPGAGAPQASEGSCCGINTLVRGWVGGGGDIITVELLCGATFIDMVLFNRGTDKCGTDICCDGALHRVHLHVALK